MTKRIYKKIYKKYVKTFKISLTLNKKYFSIIININF